MADISISALAAHNLDIVDLQEGNTSEYNVESNFEGNNQEVIDSLPKVTTVHVPALHSIKQNSDRPQETHVITRDSNIILIKVEFENTNLGEHGYLRLESAEDNAVQVLNSNSLNEWFNQSAWFNGNEVIVELWNPQDETGLTLGSMFVTTKQRPPEATTLLTPQSPTTLCGNDDRSSSNDNRVGRLYAGGCTAWLIPNGTLLTAGHCVDDDPDRGGPELPDGEIDLWGVVEFNVPSSDADGSVNVAHPDDQYPIDLSSIDWHYDGEGQGLGKDWAIFSVNRNSNTGLTPFEAQENFFRLTQGEPATDAHIRITG